MVVPTYQDGKTDEYFNLNVEEEEETVDTRKAGIYIKQLLYNANWALP